MGRIVAVSGASGVGKTTAILEMLPLLLDRGHKVVCLKRSHHPYRAGSISKKDSQRLAQLAPTYFWGSTGLWDCCQLTQVDWDQGFEEWLNHLVGLFDVVLVEGGKASPFQKFELLDSSRGFATSLCARDGLLATIGDVTVPGVPCLQRSRPHDWIDFLEQYWKQT